MLIESKIKPKSKPSRNVTVYGKAYEFKQLPATPGRYVAEVEDPAAIKALIATGAYAEFTDKVPASSLRKPSGDTPDAAARAAAAEAEIEAQKKQAAEQEAAAQAAAEAEKNKAPPVDDGLSKPDPDANGEALAAAIEDKAKTLLSGTPQAIKKALAAGPSEDLPSEVIAAALTIEKRSLNPRKKVAEALTAALG